MTPGLLWETLWLLKYLWVFFWTSSASVSCTGCFGSRCVGDAPSCHGVVGVI